MNDTELKDLLRNLESDRVERKSAFKSAKEAVRQNICAFANDLPNHQLPGVLFIGVDDDGNCTNLPITDELLLQLSDCRDNGNIIPFPSMTVQKWVLDGCEMAVVIVEPSYSTPVRYRGRAWVRVGPRLAMSSPEDERRLSEKRQANDLPSDLRPIRAATLEDLDLELFRRIYLPAAISPDVLEENNRPAALQLSSLRFITPQPSSLPTVVGLLTVGKQPRYFVYGAYIQFLRIDGTDVMGSITAQRELDGPLTDLIPALEDLLELNITTSSQFVDLPVEKKEAEYPLGALRQLVWNAVLHRTYEATNAPIRISWFADRVEIFSPGGLFGQVNQSNLGTGITDYRNPHIAEAMKNLGHIQRFGFGIPTAEKLLKENGHPPLEFKITDNSVSVTVRRAI